MEIKRKKEKRKGKEHMASTKKDKKSNSVKIKIWNTQIRQKDHE